MLPPSRAGMIEGTGTEEFHPIALIILIAEKILSLAYCIRTQRTQRIRFHDGHFFRIDHPVFLARARDLDFAIRVVF